MLVYFRIKNFRSIVDTTIDMRYGEGRAPSGYREAEDMPFIESSQCGGKKMRLAPIMAMYGQNAGGKSNLVGAVNALQLCALGGGLYYRPNRIHPEPRDTTFEICFEREGKKYVYVLSYNRLRIAREGLHVQGKLLFSIDHTRDVCCLEPIATEHYPVERLKAVLETECCKAPQEQFRTFLEIIAQQYLGLNGDVRETYDFLNGITCSLYNDISPSYAIDCLARAMPDDSREGAFQEIARYLQRLDIDIEKMEMEPESVGFPLNRGESEHSDNPSETMSHYRIVSYHRKADKGMVALDFREESQGTQVLFGLLGVVLRKLRTGGVLIIDEMDRSLHTHLLSAIVSLFCNREYNTKGAQLILTAHNTDLLDAPFLRTSQVAIVTKTLQQGTILRRLCDFRDVKNCQNLRKRYLGGLLSGIPFPIV